MSARVQKFACPTCGARIGEPCRENGKRVDPHRARVKKMVGSRKGPDSPRKGMIK